jgi:hypothetical protein
LCKIKRSWPLLDDLPENWDGDFSCSLVEEGNCDENLPGIACDPLLKFRRS